MRGSNPKIEAFLTYLRDELAYSPLTQKLYRDGLDNWMLFVARDEKNFDPQEVTVNDIRAWVAQMSRHGNSAGTIKHRLCAVRALYRYLIKRCGATHNPAANVRINRREKPLPKFIDSGEMAQILNSMDNDAIDSNDFENIRNDLILNLFYQTGMRASELVGLTDARVDLSRNELKILGKRNKERVVPFGPSLRSIIEKYISLRPLTFQSEVQQPFITDDEGNGLKYKKIYDLVHTMLDGRVSSVKRSPHVLRHTFATDMLNGGANLTSVRELLGHTSLATTQIYTHVSIGELYENYNRAHPRAKTGDK